MPPDWQFYLNAREGEATSFTPVETPAQQVSIQLVSPVKGKTKPQVDLAKAFIKVYGEDEMDELISLPCSIDLDNDIAKRTPFIDDFLYIADAENNPYIRVYEPVGKDKPLQQIFKGTLRNNAL